MKIIIRALFAAIFLVIWHSNVLGQDYIVKLSYQSESILGKNLWLENNNLKFESITDNYEYELFLDDLFNISFLNDGTAEIIIQSLVFDTIECQLESITPQEVFYKEGNQLLKSINREEIFTIIFNNTHAAIDVERYRKTYVNMHKALNSNDYKIIRKNGEVLKLKELNSIDTTKVYFTLIRNEVEMKTFLSRKNIEGIVVKEPLNKKSLKSSEIFMLSNGDSWHQVLEVNEIFADSLYVTLANSAYQNVVFPQKKEDVDGIFFFNYNTVDLTTNELDPSGF